VILCYYYRRDEIIALYVHSSPLKKTVFVTEMECVYCAVRSKYLYTIHIKFAPQGINVHGQGLDGIYCNFKAIFVN